MKTKTIPNETRCIKVRSCAYAKVHTRDGKGADTSPTVQQMAEFEDGE